MRNVLERVLNLLAFLLTVKRAVSAEEIRHTVAGYDRDNDQAFQRMFSRDKDMLRRLGIPLETTTTGALEIEYGYKIDPDAYRLPETDLSDQERAALWFAAQVVRIGGQPTGADAILKLGGSQLESGLEPFAANLGSEVDVLADLYTACGEHRLVDFRYGDTRRTVAPHGLCHRRGHWYLVGSTDRGTRVYRVDRISDHDIGERDSFVRNPDIDVGQELDTQPWEAGTEEPVTATIRFSPEISWWAERRLGREPLERVERTDGSLDVSIAVTNRAAFIGWVLGFTDQAEVLGPPELRQAVIDHIAGAA
jgi:predicted DNA-binding transcriptional regulator YafY